MSRPDYADERSYKFFRRMSDGRGADWYWDTGDPELEPTAVYPNGRCAYCGNKAHPIQAGLRRPRSSYSSLDDRSYEVTGYTCCCTGAMDEREHKVKLEQLKQRHEDEVAALEKEAPAACPEVFASYVAGLTQAFSRKAMSDFQRTNPVELAHRLSKCTQS